MPDGFEDLHEENRKYWDSVVDVHFSSKFYEVDAWIKAGMKARPWEAEVIGRLDNKNVVHLQCHFGKDTLSLLSLGAAFVTGIDYSEKAIQKAKELATATKLNGRSNFEVCAVEDVPKHFSPSKFDFAYISLGAICWIPEITTWAGAISHLLKDKASIFIHEVHPLAQILVRSENGWSLDGKYFESKEAMIDQSEGSYTENSENLGNFRTNLWNHSIGEVVSSLSNFGFVVNHLAEHPWTSFQQFPEMIKSGPERYFLPDDWLQVPLSFTIVASRG
ncbi:MAG: class I SAM-dependent methyltransferase [Actinomycetota bacterium]|nr:class I SAM-dependent methyltransferase [Actinomycetota bacterium]